MARAFRDMERIELARFFRLKGPKPPKKEAPKDPSQPLSDKGGQ
jgi:hypothetical protein